MCSDAAGFLVIRPTVFQPTRQRQYLALVSSAFDAQSGFFPAAHILPKLLILLFIVGLKQLHCRLGNPFAEIRLRRPHIRLRSSEKYCKISLEIFCDFGYDSFHRGQLSFWFKGCGRFIQLHEVPSVFFFPTFFYTKLRPYAANYTGFPLEFCMVFGIMEG